VREKADELERTKQNHEREMKCLEEAQHRNDHEAQALLAAEKRRREEVTQQLERELEEKENKIRAEEVRRQRAKEQKEAKRREMEFQKKEEAEKLSQAEKKRQRDQLVNHNSTRALQELRELIRERYELDMEIYRLRNISYSNRDVVMARMEKSDEILQKIYSVIETWSPESFDETEWDRATEVKERLLAPGKRIWAVDPPWPTDARGGRPPPRGGRPPPRGGGARRSLQGERRVVSGGGDRA